MASNADGYIDGSSLMVMVSHEPASYDLCQDVALGCVEECWPNRSP